MRVFEIIILVLALTMVALGCADDSGSDDGVDTGGGDADADADADGDADVDWSECANGILHGNVSIEEQPSVGDIAGHTGIDGNLFLRTAIADVTELACLTSVDGDLTISDNGSLETLEGLNALTTVTGTLTILDNAALTSLDALGALESVGGLIIGNNPVLSGLGGLSSLTVVAESIEIYGNASVPDCEVCDLGNQLTELPPDRSTNENLFDGCSPVILPCQRPTK